MTQSQQLWQRSASLQAMIERKDVVILAAVSELNERATELEMRASQIRDAIECITGVIERGGTDEDL